jgi:ATP-dependent protease HslVU (ClpYQ) peptidase subunit
MTCVVGLIAEGRVYIGADSAAVAGWTRRKTLLKKVFRRGPFLIGYTTSFRMGQLLEHQLEVPRQADRESDMSFMVNQFIESTRTLLKSRGFSKVESNNEKGGQFLVGYRGRLYSVESDFQVGEMSEGFDAVGSGSDYALGAMAALPKLPPKRRILRSLEIAAEFSMGVSAPFVVRSMKSP